MAFFTPITDANRLPRLGSAYEHATFDAKTSARSGAGNRADFDRPELAKDVAAFANALGGTLLVGAHEDLAAGVIDRLAPLDDAEAQATMTAYDEAVLSFCSPQPVFTPARIGVPGGVVVAINVWPYPGQPVGCSKDGAGNRGRSFRFPLRVGRATAWVEPAQLAMFSDPQTRRIAIALEAIPSPKRRGLLFLKPRGGGTAPPSSWEFLRVDILANTALFVEPAGGTRFQVYGIPLDDIETVWNGGARWCVRFADKARWPVPDVVDSLDGV